MHLKYRYLMNIGITELRENVSEDTLCRKTKFKHVKKGSKRMDMISVISVINKSKF